MKLKILTSIFFTFILSLIVSGQETILNPSQYKSLKAKGELPFSFKLKPEYQAAPGSTKYSLHPNNDYAKKEDNNNSCSCIIPRDSTFQVVPMDQGNPPEWRCDDCASLAMDLPFDFCFFGEKSSKIYINKNGNISLDSAIYDYNPNAFPSVGNRMVSPFWADVDDTDSLDTVPSRGLVLYKLTPTHLIVKWDSVGYYLGHNDKVNTFQLIITDGKDPILPGGNNVSFCYKDMQWTTGDVSPDGNVGGFGGMPAVVGSNKGDGNTFIQFGTFDAPDSVYNGQFNPSGVKWLNNKSFTFNTCIDKSTNNIPPVLNSSKNCDTLVICQGDSTKIAVSFLSPEPGQTTVLSISDTGKTGVSINNVNGNIANAEITVKGINTNVGVQTIYLKAIDDGTPSDTTVYPIYVKILDKINTNFSASPDKITSTNTPVTFTPELKNAGAYDWNFGDGKGDKVQTPNHAFNYSTGKYTVSLKIDIDGCKDSSKIEYMVCDTVFIPNIFTPNGDGVNDLLYVRGGVCLQNMVFTIYNRWGQKVFETKNITEGWNGRFSPSGEPALSLSKEGQGEELNPAIFAWTLSGVKNDIPYNAKGMVSLLK